MTDKINIVRIVSFLSTFGATMPEGIFDGLNFPVNNDNDKSIWPDQYLKLLF